MRRPEREAPKGAPYTPDAATHIMAPAASLVEGPSAYPPDAATRTLAVAIDDDDSEEDPFAARATDASLSSQPSGEVALEELPVDDEEGAATRVDRAVLEDDEGDEPIDLSLSGLEPVAEGGALGEDTLVNAPMLSDEETPPFLPARPQRPTTNPRGFSLADAPVKDPAALFDEGGGTRPPVAAPPAPATRVGGPPSLASHPSHDDDDDEDAEGGGDTESRASGWNPPSVADSDYDDEETLAPLEDLEQPEEPEELTNDPEDPPLVHRWKVVPTALRQLEGAPRPQAAPPPPEGYGDSRPRTLQTVIWPAEEEGDEEQAPAAPSSAEPSRNPFWAPTDVREAADDEDLQSSEAQLPSSPLLAAAAYVHDSVAYLRSLSSFGAHLDDEVRRAFDERLLGCNQRLRRALAILHTAEEEAAEED